MKKINKTLLFYCVISLPNLNSAKQLGNSFQTWYLRNPKV